MIETNNFQTVDAPSPATGSGGLTIVPTPIGNVGDVTLRALDALRASDVVLAEDTRVTGKLLAALGIEGTRLERLDENLMAERAPGIIRRVQDGENIAYCTDAGMPGVSDPGLRLVAAARAAEPPVRVEVLPGPSAAATAYVASGTTARTFYFGSFFPRKDKARRDLLASLRALDAALIFYESPNRLVGALETIAEELPARQVAVCRELTKLHEEVVRGKAAEVFETFAARSSVKGEVAIVIDPPGDAELDADSATAREMARARATELAERGESSKSIAKRLAAEFDIPRNEAYALTLRSSD